MAARKVVLGATAMLVVVALAWAAIASLQSASQEKAHTLGDYLLAQPESWTDENAVAEAAAQLGIPSEVSGSFPVSGWVTITSPIRQTSACLELPRGEMPTYRIREGICGDDLVG